MWLIYRSSAKAKVTQATSNPAYELRKELEEVDDNNKYEPLSTSPEQKTIEQQTAADGDPVNDEKMEYDTCDDQTDSQPQVQEPLYEEL